MAVTKAVKKLNKKPENLKEIAVLVQAYKLANQQNLDRILYLKKTGQPDIWEEVFQNYETLKARQDLVKGLPENVLTAIAFEYVSYDNDIIESQKKACEYYYVHALQLLNGKNKLDARQAYDELQKIKTHYSDYKDVNTLLIKAKIMGTTFVLFQMQNNSYGILPADFEYEFMKISLSDLDGKWIVYDTKPDENTYYEYSIIMSLKNIDVSPERIREKNWIESREIQDGWIYEYDQNGNVRKDSLGNDIKRPRFINISCKLAEFSQSKQCVLAGRLDFYKNDRTQLLNSEQITANSGFTNIYLMANGNLAALNAETAKRLGGGPVPFPTDFDMIMLANEFLQKAVKDKIRSNAYRLK